MNVEQIYRFHRDEAFAKQFTASEYSTFVAMPFGNTPEYNADAVYACLKDHVHLRTNQLRAAAGLPKPFAALRRVSEHMGSALIVTDTIAIGILTDHFFVGDLTGNNPGALLETGAALALKPLERIVLLTQEGGHAALHFDVKVTYVNGYALENLVERVAHALVGAATAFEREAAAYVTSVSASLTSDAIHLLNRYGVISKGQHRHPPSLFKHPHSSGPLFEDPDGPVRFQNAVRELLLKRLLWTDYKANAQPGVDLYGAHATELGWQVIGHIWQHDREMRKYEGAPTGPT